ncbi:MAG: septation regulator SpoVG [Gracilibacteraceae bacterium]|jgi:stage V sporulation protein G|nr:septation regulator SpoVG [Gracilibacteraceae bacterium]
MNITDVRVRRVKVDGKMKAVVSVAFDDEFVVHDIKVVNGPNGLFVVMPSRKTSAGEFRDIAHPISTAAREKIQSRVLREYEKTEYAETAPAL